jgi:DNA-directed RNA polymerase specialized sigma24 family protein
VLSIPRKTLLNSPAPIARFEAGPKPPGRRRSARRVIPIRANHETSRPEQILQAEGSDGSTAVGNAATAVAHARSLVETFLRHLSSPSRITAEAANTRNLVSELSRVIRTRAARAIPRYSEADIGRRELKGYVEELTQDVLLVIFAERARVLREWDPAGGLSLRNYVGLVAEREVADILRSVSRRPWNVLRPQLEAGDPELAMSPGAEPRVHARDMLASIVSRLHEERSPLAAKLFKLLFIDECSIEEACAATGLSRCAIYAWRSRLPKMVRRIEQAMSIEG